MLDLKYNVIQFEKNLYSKFLGLRKCFHVLYFIEGLYIKDLTFPFSRGAYDSVSVPAVYLCVCVCSTISLEDLEEFRPNLVKI